MAVTGLFGNAFLCYLLCFYIGKIESSPSYKWNNYPDSVDEPGPIPPLPKPVFDFAAYESSLQSNRVIGGKTSSANKYPFMVNLRYSQGSSIFCGGSLISDEWVLTAAHCTPSGWSNTKPWGKAYINDFSVSKIDSGEQMFGIEKWFMHPNYNSSWSHTYDAALIKLDGKVSGITPIKVTNIPKDAGLPYDATTAGWGKLKNSKEVIVPDLLQEYDLHHYPWTVEACTKRLTGKVCYGNPKPIAVCSGDSGGPLFYKNSNNEWEVIGIASLGWFGTATWPDIWAFVGDPTIRKWITELTGV